MSDTIIKPRRTRTQLESQSMRLTPETNRLSKGLIAELSDEQIHEMTHDELARVVLAVNVDALPHAPSSRLRNMDRETLERLAFLTRHCCQNQGY